MLSEVLGKVSQVESRNVLDLSPTLLFSCSCLDVVQSKSNSDCSYRNLSEPELKPLLTGLLPAVYQSSLQTLILRTIQFNFVSTVFYPSVQEQVNFQNI